MEIREYSNKLPEELAQEIRKLYDDEKPGTVRFMALYDFLELDERTENRDKWKASVETNAHPHPSTVASLIDANTRVAIVSARIAQRESEQPNYFTAFHEARTHFVAWREALIAHHRPEKPTQLFGEIRKATLSK
jgi:hypothetical protein